MQVLPTNTAFVDMSTTASGGNASPPRPTVIPSSVSDRPQGSRRRSHEVRRQRSRSVGALRRSQWQVCAELCPDCYASACRAVRGWGLGPLDDRACQLAKPSARRRAVGLPALSEDPRSPSRATC
jgi:hypothetical protein